MSREILEHILDDTEKHIDWLETQPDCVRRVRYMCHLTVAVSVRGAPGMLYMSALPCAER